MDLLLEVDCGVGVGSVDCDGDNMVLVVCCCNRGVKPNCTE